MYSSISLTLLLIITLVKASKPVDVNKSFKLLCKNTQQSVHITRISEIAAIIKELRSDLHPTEECSEEVKNSILDLDLVIDDTDDVCTMKKVEQINLYHSKYVQANNNNDKTKSHLPQSLKNFFIGYSLKVSSICKKNMINNLIMDTRLQLTPEDFKSLDLWTRNEEGSIFNNLKGPADYDDLLLSSDLIRLTETENSPINNEKIFIQAGSGKFMNKIQTVCRKRFKPFYEKLIIPVVKLANIGYNYQGEELERELSEIRTNKEVAQWYEIVYLCQALEDIVIVESEEDKVRTAGLDKKLVKILTKEEAMMLKKTSFNDGDKLAASVDGYDDDDELEQIIYKPEEGNPIEDVILDEKDENLKKSIKSFDTNKSDLDRIRSKLFWKMGNFLKDSLINGKFKIIISTLFERKHKQSNGEALNPRTEVVRAFDEYVQQMTRSNDNPVAGLTDYAKRGYQNAVYLGPSGIAHRINEKTLSPFNYGKAFWRFIAIVIVILALTMLFIHPVAAG